MSVPIWKKLLASRWFFVAAAAAMLAVWVGSQVEYRPNPRPRGEPSQIAELAERDDLNLLFILIDTLRADRLGTYGYERDTSPHIDALARDGIRFARQMSQSSWTKCSMASLWTGLHPARTGVLRSPHAISDDARMPAEILQEAGFRTYALWRNNWISPSFGFSQGFDVYHSPRPRPIPPSLRREKPTIARGGSDQDIVLSAKEFLRTHRNERWFLYLHLMDVHQYVYDKDTALFGTTYSDIYDNSIRWVDRVVGSLLDDLDGHGLRDRTLIVVAADHGEAFGEHGREGHARDVYGEVVTTPFILSLPFRLDSGVVVDVATENVDVWPTLLDLLGLPALEDADGRSRVPEIQVAAVQNENGSEPNPRYAHIDQTWARQGEEPRPMVAVTDGPYRLVYRAGRAAELYDQSVDPGEQRNVGAERPEVLERMSRMAEDYLAQPAAPWGAAPAVDLSPEQLEELRALGYVIE